MPQSDSVIAELNRVEKSPFHVKLHSHVMLLADMSRQAMSKHYSKWDDQQMAYKAFQNLDKADKKAIEEGRPTKQKVPMVYAKLHTFRAFVLDLFFQRQKFYEMQPVGSEDEDYRKLAETLLERDLQRNKWLNTLYRFTGHIGKFGIGVLKHTWDEEFAYIPQTTIIERKFMGVSYKTDTVVEHKQVTKGAGNKVTTVSPYQFLPDTRHPLTDIEKGEFCADESEYSMMKLQGMEYEGKVAGVKYVNPMSQNRAGFRQRHFATRYSNINYNNPTNTATIVRVIEMQLKLIPYHFELADGQRLGQEKFPVKYLIWIANDDRIIKCEPMGYLHDSFTYDVAQFDEDEEELISKSLSELVSPLQDLSDWFFNTRVESVSKNLEDKLVVDPIGIDIESIKNRGRLILTKKGASRQGVDSFIKQLDVRDVTANHPQDIALVGQMVNSVTGVNENAGGNYHTGRRSATEARVVTQGAASRQKLIASCIWGACLAPLGSKLLTNLRQGLTPELILRYAGNEWAKPEKQAGLVAFTGDTESLVSASDMWVYDGTLQSEKGYLAQSLMELFQQVIALGPTGLLQTEISPKLLLQKIYELIGLPDFDTFNLLKDPQTLQNVVQQIAQQMAVQMLEQQAAQQQNGQPQLAGESGSPA